MTGHSVKVPPKRLCLILDWLEKRKVKYRLAQSGRDYRVEIDGATLLLEGSTVTTTVCRDGIRGSSTMPRSDISRRLDSLMRSFTGSGRPFPRDL